LYRVDKLITDDGIHFECFDPVGTRTWIIWLRRYFLFRFTSQKLRIMPKRCAEMNETGINDNRSFHIRPCRRTMSFLAR
jgi:hypothetical protein